MERGRSLLLVIACLLAAFLAAALSGIPSSRKGAGPRPALDNLLAARALATTGVAAIEDGEHGIALSSMELIQMRDAGELPPPSAAGNRLTITAYGTAMAWAPALVEHPERLSGLLAALATLLVALAAQRLLGGGAAPLAAVLYATLPVAWIAGASPGHLDLACVLAAGMWPLVVGRGAHRLHAIVLAGVLAGLATLARDSFIVAPWLGALALLVAPEPVSLEPEPPHPDGPQRAPALSMRRRLLAACGLTLVAAAVYAGGGGLHSVYTDPALRGHEFHRLGHAFPDFVTYEVWRGLSPAERAEHPLTRDLDERLAGIYAGEGDPTPGGMAGKLVSRTRESLPFYLRELIVFDSFGGPLILLLTLAGALAPPGRQGVHRRGSLLAILGAGLAGFLALHCVIGTSNESHLAVLAAPIALALAAGVLRLARTMRPPGRGRATLLLALLAALLLHQALASKVAMSRLYQGAGRARFGMEDELELAHAVATTGLDLARPRVAVGRRGEDVFAIALYADRSAVALSPATLSYLAGQGQLASWLEEHRIGVLAGYPPAALETPAIRAALDGRAVVAGESR